MTAVLIVEPISREAYSRACKTRKRAWTADWQHELNRRLALTCFHCEGQKVSPATGKKCHHCGGTGLNTIKGPCAEGIHEHPFSQGCICACHGHHYGGDLGVWSSMEEAARAVVKLAYGKEIDSDLEHHTTCFTDHLTCALVQLQIARMRFTREKNSRPRPFGDDW